MRHPDQSGMFLTLVLSVTMFPELTGMCGRTEGGLSLSEKEPFTRVESQME